jgi:hypothetical protein
MGSPRSLNEQMDEEQEWLQTTGDYKHGSIKRIRLVKFLTYSEVEFSPKPRYDGGKSCDFLFSPTVSHTLFAA